MNRLIIKIRTDSKAKGTLLETNRESMVGEVITQIVDNADDVPKTDEVGQPIEYRLIRLGSPKRVLENDRSFAQENIKNSDLLLISPDPDSVMSQGLFDFEALTAENQYISVQDLRAPIRMLPRFAAGGVKVNAKKKESRTITPKDATQANVSTSTVDHTKEPDQPHFDFQPLDIEIPEKKKEKASTPRSSRKASKNKKGK